MKKINILSKMNLSLVLLFSLILVTGNLTSTKAETPKDPFVAQFNQLAAKYITDCDDWDATARVSGEKLKQCLTIAKELRDKFDTFLQRVESRVTKIKTAKRWTRELDEAFENNAARQGINSKLIAKVKETGGFRAYYDKNIAQAKPSRADFAGEIEALEAAIQKNVSAHHARPHAGPVFGVRLQKAVQWVRDAVDLVFIGAEAVAGAI